MADGARVLHENEATKASLALKQNRIIEVLCFLTLQAFHQKGRQKEKLCKDTMFSWEAFADSFSCKHYRNYESGVFVVFSRQMFILVERQLLSTWRHIIERENKDNCKGELPSKLNVRVTQKNAIWRHTEYLKMKAPRCAILTTIKSTKVSVTVTSFVKSLQKGGLLSNNNSIELSECQQILLGYWTIKPGRQDWRLFHWPKCSCVSTKTKLGNFCYAASRLHM